MGVNVNTYILIGTDVGVGWGSLPTDGQGDQDEYDDWHDRYGELIIYRPKKGDIVCFDDMDGAHYMFIGKVIDVHHDRKGSAEFHETFSVERLSNEINEVSALLLERYGITSEVNLHIISNYT